MLQTGRDFDTYLKARAPFVFEKEFYKLQQNGSRVPVPLPLKYCDQLIQGALIYLLDVRCVHLIFAAAGDPVFIT